MARVSATLALFPAVVGKLTGFPKIKKNFRPQKSQTLVTRDIFLLFRPHVPTWPPQYGGSPLNLNERTVPISG